MPLNHFGTVGLGTRKYQQDNEPVKVCQEMLLPGCDCCRIGPCKLCLTWTVGTKVYLGKASGDGQEWSGSAGAVSFRAYWDESYCTINVELDGELVWTRSLCEDYDAVTCRNWDDDTAFTTYAGDSGTFAWEVTEFLELLRRTGGEAYSESECADYFCGTCSCTCPKLCVTITTDEAGCEGTIPFTGEQCDDGRVTSPEWSGAIDCGAGDPVDVAIALTRDSYGDCQISGTVDGTIGGNAVALALVETPITDCKALATTWAVAVGEITYTVEILCLECGECGGCCSSQPDVLYCTFTGNGCTCIDGVSVPMTKVSTGNGWEYSGDPGACFPPNPMLMSFNIECTQEDDCNGWTLHVQDVQGCHPLPQTYEVREECSCDPLILEWDVPFSGLGGCCQGGMVDTTVRFTVTR